CETHPVFEKFGLAPRVDLIFDNYEVALRKISDSNAWGFLPDWLVRRAGLSAIVPEGWDAPVNISVLWPKNRILTQVMRQLIDELETAFARRPSGGAQTRSNPL